jgi:DNA-binding SARP family transcriptional activator
MHELLETGRYWEKHKLWDFAIQSYQKGLVVDDLVEAFYQRLMTCFLETGRYSEGMATYRRCRQLLSVVIGVQPEPGTRKLYDMLKTARSLDKHFVNPGGDIHDASATCHTLPGCDA